MAHTPKSTSSDVKIPPLLSDARNALAPDETEAEGLERQHRKARIHRGVEAAPSLWQALAREYRFDDAPVAREIARDARLKLVERGEIRLARAGLRQIGLRARTALSPRIPRLHRGAPIPRCSVHIGARCWDRTTKMGSFHAPICPKPARTLSRKDWHSSANGAVV